MKGAQHFWINCCHWRVLQDGVQLAWSEDDRTAIERATFTVNGQKLTAVSADPKSGKSKFVFDLGALIETWPYGDDPTDKQWMLTTDTKTFAYRADGLYSIFSNTASRDSYVWLALAPDEIEAAPIHPSQSHNDQL